jgi:hypothetical protein
MAAMIGTFTRRMRKWNGSFMKLKMSLPVCCFIAAVCFRSNPAQKVPQSLDVRMATRHLGV